MENITHLHLPLAEAFPPQSVPASAPPTTARPQSWLQPACPLVEPVQPTQQSMVEPDCDRTATNELDSTFYSYPTMYF